MFVATARHMNAGAPLGATDLVGGKPPPRWNWRWRATNMRLLRSQDSRIYITLNTAIRREPILDRCAILIAGYATHVAYIVL